MAHEGLVCGVDEAGRGPLAGPVVAAAVVFMGTELGQPPKTNCVALPFLDDSKKLTEKKREVLYEEIMSRCVVGVGIIEAEEIDELNILQAALKAMETAVMNAAKKSKMDIVLIDGNVVPKFADERGRPLMQNVNCVIGGDGKSASIAAASVVAKVTRDRLMLDMARKYPLYGFEKHKGYGTAAHIEAIKQYGLCETHRKTFCRKLRKSNEEGSYV